MDKIDEEFLIEVKKSISDEEAGVMQLLLYMDVLRNKGIEKRGKVIFVEDGIEIEVEWSEENKNKLKYVKKDIEKLLGNSIPEELPEKKSICTKCAYREYCYL